MAVGARLLAVIPARGGSKGLPGKNIRLFMGLPLIAHSILVAKICSEIDRLIISTDADDIALVARRFGADVPFMRPAELAQDETPIWPVLRHALFTAENLDRVKYEYLLLLDPTSPTRSPEDIAGAYGKLRETPEADGIIAVSQPDFNPLWHCVVESEGWMRNLIEMAPQYARRQDVPTVYRINGSLYIWRSAFVRVEEEAWRSKGKYLMYETPEFRAISIDDLHQFKRAELMVKSGLITLPWLNHYQKKH